MGLFREHALPLSVSMIPSVVVGDVHDPATQEVKPLRRQKAERVSRALGKDRLDVLLHGYNHQTWRTKSEGPYTEFEGLTYAQQYSRIAKGKACLEALFGCPVRSFVPPWETYDDTTIRVLVDLGFDSLCAQGWGIDTPIDALQYLPSTCGLAGLATSVQAARQSGNDCAIIVVLFHAYDFRESNPKHGKSSIPDLRALLAWVASQRDVKVQTVSQTIASGQDLGPDRALSLHRLRTLEAMLPSEPSKDSYYLTLEESRRLRTNVWLWIGAIYFPILLLAALCGTAPARMLAAHRRALTVACVLALIANVLLGVWVFHDGRFGFRGISTLTATVGASVGMWTTWFVLSRQAARRRHPITGP